jgi:hypothetical protein
MGRESAPATYWVNAVPAIVAVLNRDDLLFRERDPLHRPAPDEARTLTLRGGNLQWQVKTVVSTHKGQ